MEYCDVLIFQEEVLLLQFVDDGVGGEDIVDLPESEVVPFVFAQEFLLLLGIGVAGLTHGRCFFFVELLSFLYPVNRLEVRALDSILLDSG